MEEPRTPEAVAKSLRWLSNMFPVVIGSDDRGDRMSTCIHMYTASGADTISTLQAENGRLRVELEQVKRECDEAVQCIRGIAKSGRVWMCPYCVHAKDTTGGIAECELDVGVCMMPYSKFEWRGQKED